MKKSKQWLVGFLVLVLSPLPGPTEPPPLLESSKSGVTQTLIDLLEKQDKTRFDPEDYQSTSLRQLITFATPAGYRLKLRYLEFGMSLVEALKVARDPDLKKRLIEMAQWSRRPRVRAEAIITLAGLYNPDHKKYFKSAVLDSKVGIRYAAIEALQRWNQEGTIPLLRLSMDRDWSPFMQIHAAQALLSLGEEDAIAVLWKFLDHKSWIVRAMAARYLGDYAQPGDYEKLNRALIRENKNDFVVAELAVACLKLISQKGDRVSYSPASAGYRKNQEVQFTLGRGGIIELEPLIIVPPRLRIPHSLRVASQINTKLLIILKDRLDVQLDPIQAQDPILQDLNGLVTPAGFALKTRYAEISYLLIEGLAGTNDPLLRSELENLAQRSSNPLVRATAIISLSYNRNPNDFFLIQEGARHKNAIVRMGVMEAIEIGQFREGLSIITNIANGDPSPALRVYAMQLLSRFGDSSGRNLMLSHINDPDWPSRAMAFWYLGRYGDPGDYTLILSKLPFETNPFVKAEITLSCLRLSPFDE